MLVEKNNIVTGFKEKQKNLVQHYVDKELEEIENVSKTTAAVNELNKISNELSTFVSPIIIILFYYFSILYIYFNKKTEMMC